MTDTAATKKRAPKVPSLTPIADNGAWRVTVPPSKSSTGKKQRLKFKTKRAAELEIERIKSMATKWGTISTKISPALAQDATKAAKVIEGYDMSLYAVVKEWKAWKQAQAASVTFQQLFDEYKADKVAEGISTVYLRDIEKFFAPFLGKLGGKIVSEIQHTEIKEILNKFKTTRQRANAYRTVRPAFAMAVTENYAAANVFDRIKVPKHVSRAPESLNVAEVKAVFNACADYKERDDLIKDYKVDATDAAHAFAIMVFAGVRPEEITRLQWDAIHLDDDCIIIGGDVAKTRSHRIIPIEANLADWLKTVPESERTGAVVPSNWKKKYQVVRKISGIGKRQQDILRHTFASAHLAAYNDFKELQAAMGHGTTEMILKHYKALMKKPEGVKFWSIRPNSTDAQLAAVG
jgi:integrase